jgi:hypothetical protein
MRKTAFVLSIWGGGEECDIRAASRLKSFEMLARYKKDATTVIEAANSKGVVPKIGRWRSCYVESYQTVCRITNSGKSLHEIIALFTHMNKIAQDDSIIVMCEKISSQSAEGFMNSLHSLQEYVARFLLLDPTERSASIDGL